MSAPSGPSTEFPWWFLSVGVSHVVPSYESGAVVRRNGHEVGVVKLLTGLSKYVGRLADFGPGISVDNPLHGGLGTEYRLPFLSLV